MPKAFTSPEVAGKRPQMIEMRVVLPAPLWPDDVGEVNKAMRSCTR
jgi:hypothetical protein